jgi:hypothetical protein
MENLKRWEGQGCILNHLIPEYAPTILGYSHSVYGEAEGKEAVK